MVACAPNTHACPAKTGKQLKQQVQRMATIGPARTKTWVVKNVVKVVLVVFLYVHVLSADECSREALFIVVKVV